MAQYFDSFSSPALLGYDEEVKRRGKLDEIMSSQPAAFTNVTATQAPVLQQAGYVAGQNEGEFVVPERALANYQNERITSAQDAMRARYEATLNNPIFRVGDTLADVGRMFLSPLIFLKGEDLSQYDPSGKIQAGYRERFDQMESLRVQNVQGFLNARNNRAANYMTMLKTGREMSTPSSTFAKQLKDFAMLTGRLNEYNSGDQTIVDRLQQDFMVREGKGYRLPSGTFLTAQANTLINDYSKQFTNNTKGILEAAMKYEQLLASLSQDSGSADVASIFNFMKALDPESVVRDSEVRMASNTAGLYDSLVQKYEELKTGESLPDGVKRDMAEIATALMSAYMNMYQDFRNEGVGKARLYGLNDEELTPFFRPLFQLPPIPQAGAFIRPDPRKKKNPPLPGPAPVPLPADVGARVGEINQRVLDMQNGGQ